MQLAKAYKKMLKGYDWDLRSDTNHHNLYVNGTYIYGFSMGPRISLVKDEVKRKIRRVIRDLKRGK